MNIDNLQSTFDKHKKLVLEHLIVESKTENNLFQNVSEITVSKRGSPFYYFKSPEWSGPMEFQVVKGDTVSAGSYNDQETTFKVPGAQFVIKWSADRPLKSSFSSLAQVLKSSGFEVTEPQSRSVEQGGYTVSGRSPVHYSTYTWMGITKTP